MKRTVATGEYRNGGRAWRFTIAFHPGVKHGLNEWIRHTIRSGGKSIKAGGAFTCEAREVK